jgi:hypothetical protein
VPHTLAEPTECLRHAGQVCTCLRARGSSGRSLGLDCHQLTIRLDSGEAAFDFVKVPGYLGEKVSRYGWEAWWGGISGLPRPKGGSQ